MKYEEMSDFEINQLVAISEGVDIPLIDGVFNIIDGNVAVSTDPNGGLNRKRLFLDYCNNPSDAWPIIVENEITIAKHVSNDDWEAFGGGYQVNYNHEVESIKNSECICGNPLRAGMICFLKMKGIESDQ